MPISVSVKMIYLWGALTLVCVFKVEKPIAALASSTLLEILKERVVDRIAVTCETKITRLLSIIEWWRQPMFFSQPWLTRACTWNNKNILKLTHLWLRRRFASHHEWRRRRSGASCPSWSPRTWFCTHPTQSHPMPADKERAGYSLSIYKQKRNWKHCLSKLSLPWKKRSGHRAQKPALENGSDDCKNMTSDFCVLILARLWFEIERMLIDVGKDHELKI